jgi:hypothetical protein
MKFSKILSTVSVLGSNFYLASGAFAINAVGGAAGGSSVGNADAQSWLGRITGGSNAPDFETWIGNLVNLMIGLAALICVIVLIASGYTYITAAGDETKIEKATKSLTYAIVGLVICFISVILVQFVFKQVLFPTK